MRLFHDVLGCLGKCILDVPMIKPFCCYFCDANKSHFFRSSFVFCVFFFCFDVFKFAFCSCIHQNIFTELEYRNSVQTSLISHTCKFSAITHIYPLLVKSQGSTSYFLHCEILLHKDVCLLRIV